ncbi:unnamed protein product [Heligmosomoides polygyrus]|uniref:RING-type domain-containing protein n=1 Tax=Heligmosomoides polygyrus TaxID=6339 RepID=A0A3P7YUI4_HELPZ|nr:unnamed protein product [Heligmosomoides polygyrus]
MPLFTPTVLIVLCFFVYRCALAQHGETGTSSVPFNINDECSMDVKKWTSTCYKPTNKWTHDFRKNAISAMKNCKDGCIAKEIAQLIKDNIFSFLSQKCYVRCPCLSPSFCDDAAAFVKQDCPWEMNAGASWSCNAEQNTKAHVQTTKAVFSMPGTNVMTTSTEEQKSFYYNGPTTSEGSSTGYSLPTENFPQDYSAKSSLEQESVARTTSSTSRGYSDQLQVGCVVFSSTAVVLFVFRTMFDQVTSTWSCLGRFTLTSTDLWFPLVQVNAVAALAATSYSYKGLYIRRNLPQYQEMLDEFARSVPGDMRNTIEKCHRDLHFTMAEPWLLLGYWQFLAVASDWVTDPLTVAFALLYCAMDLLQFVVTTPSVTLQQGDMDSDKTVAVLSGANIGSRHEVEPGRNPGQIRERRKGQTQTNEGYLPRVVRRELEERWSDAYPKLREKHPYKTKASVIEHERMMRGREEIVQGLYLFNGPPPIIRGSMLERNRVEVKDRPSQSVPIAIVTAIDDYGNTYQQAVLKAPVAVVRDELLPSTSRDGDVDRLERE